ncbi:MAG: hypothetical protein JWO53_835, partial [Chlamydiia bacterium]|nr:hypothetical protein [Chlamydiia bacterium]
DKNVFAGRNDLVREILKYYDYKIEKIPYRLIEPLCRIHDTITEIRVPDFREVDPTGDYWNKGNGNYVGGPDVEWRKRLSKMSNFFSSAQIVSIPLPDKLIKIEYKRLKSQSTYSDETMLANASLIGFAIMGVYSHLSRSYSLNIF